MPAHAETVTGGRAGVSFGGVTPISMAPTGVLEDLVCGELG